MADQQDFLGRFDAMSSKATATVIAHCSSSFTLASKLLSPKIRRDIEALYAMVRVADEVVDGAAAARVVSRTPLRRFWTITNARFCSVCPLLFTPIR